jgi:uncharacterized membrane protein YgaE (UPF0421/DUF939 family)
VVLVGAVINQLICWFIAGYGFTPVNAAFPWRLPLVVAIAAGLVWSICNALGLASAAAYGVVIAAVVVRPDFQAWPTRLYIALPLVVLIGLSLGTWLKPLLAAPIVWEFAVVTAMAQLIGQLLPDRLAMLRNLLPILAILPLLSSSSTWLAAWQQLVAVMLGLGVAVGMQAIFRSAVDRDSQQLAVSKNSPKLEFSRSVGERFSDYYFWRKLIFSVLALAIGQGVGAVNPKYVYFGVVLLLNDSIGATLGKVRDRMVGVSIGILMPWIVFNAFGVNSISLALVMGGTVSMMMLFGFYAHLKTALISSGVTFAGYQALTDWYIPTRWIDYLLGCGLALLVCLLFSPSSALKQFRRLAQTEERLTAELLQLLPSAREEALWLGQKKEFEVLVGSLETTPQS